MRFSTYKALVLIVAVGLYFSVPPATQGQSRSKLTLEAIHGSTTFSSKSFRGGRWAEEGPVIIFVEGREGDVTDLMAFNLETESRERLIDGDRLFAEDVNRAIHIEDYSYSADGRQVLLYTDSERVWRQNTKGYYYLFDLDTQSLEPISDRDAGFQMFAKLSPNGKQVAFVRDRNIFLVDLANGEEKQLTHDGSDGAIINGTSDWVYEEEFRLRDGFSWSPDGRYLAFYQFDESDTREFVMADLLGQYPELEEFRYPKAGEANSEVQVGVIDVETGERHFFETGTWFGDDTYEYIPQMGWTPAIEGQHFVWMIRLNRNQNNLDLLYGDPDSREVDIVFQEEESTWIDVNSGKLQYLQDGRRFVWMAETSGYRHLYIHQNTGARISQITQGDWEVANFLGIDEEAGKAYFTATIESSLERHLYSQVLEAGATPRRITERAGTHSINLSKDRKYYIDSYSNAITPPQVTLHRINGRQIRILEGNTDLKETLSRYTVPAPEFISVEGADGQPLNAYMIKPDNFDPQVAYPMLMYVYGGPGSQTVSNRWGGSRYLWHAYLANELNMLVVSVDNRGTGARGKAFKGATYKKLGQLESVDQIAAAQQLGQLSYVDENRIGIWGWSYGGYMTLMSMLNKEGPETFKFGMSVAPVTDWGQYDTIYTERYMSTPQENPSGYELGAPQTYADRMADHQRVLLVHGDFDDNVHFQNAAQMANIFQEANKQFDFMMYPGRNHGIYGGNSRLHLFTLMTRFIRESINEPALSQPEAD